MENLLIPIILPIGMFITCVVTWFLTGRDEKGKGVIAYRAKPIKGFGVLETGVILDDVIHAKDIALEIMNLQLQGILELTPKKVLILKIEKTGKEHQKLTTGQKILIDALFPQTDTELRLKRNTQVIKIRIKYLKKQLYKDLTEKGYYDESPQGQREIFYGLASLLMMGPLAINLVMLIFYIEGSTETLYSIPVEYIISIFICGIISGLFGSIMAKKNHKGTILKEKMLGLKEYIQTAEKDRIKFILENNIDAYRELLPYAGLFNSIEKWIETLKDTESAINTDQFSEISLALDELDFSEGFEERRFILLFIVSVFLTTITFVLKSWLEVQANRFEKDL